MKNHGGARKGAGRKSDKTSAFTIRIEKLCSNLINDVLKDDVLYDKLLKEEVKRHATPKIEMFKEDCIYIIKNNGFYKIGYTSDLNKRLKNYKTHLGFVDLIYYSKQFNSFGIESEIHNIFAEYRVTGEWFDLSDKQLINCISFCSNKSIK